MPRVFLDANILFSAAYDPASRLVELWNLQNVELVTSAYAAGEALRNIAAKRPRRLQSLSELLSSLGMIDDSASVQLPKGITLPEKDLPILRGAIACGASFLLTGDSDFDRYFGQVIDGVLVMRPGDFIRLHDKTGR
jgi:predicted nucleic acid-binding protein